MKTDKLPKRVSLYRRKGLKIEPLKTPIFKILEERVLLAEQTEEERWGNRKDPGDYTPVDQREECISGTGKCYKLCEVVLIEEENEYSALRIKCLLPLWL